MKKILIIFIVIILIILVLSITLIFYFRNNKTIKEEEIELKEDYFKWFNSTAKEYEFDDPYVKCIFDKTCNGTFDIILHSNLSNSIEIINDTLKEFGKIKYIRVLNDYSILLNVNELELINNFIDSPLFYKIVLSNIYSDYKINISEEDLSYCESDYGCIKVNNNCCAGSSCGYKSINRKYNEIWQTQFYSCRFVSCLAVVCFFNKLPACENNQCVFLDFKNCTRDNDCILSKEKGCINKEVFNRFSYNSGNDLDCKCEDYECIEVEKENKTDEGNLIINITQPINNISLITNSVNIIATTNKKAICKYSKRDNNLENEIELKLMSITNDIFHSQLIENLQEGYYIIKLNCTDESGISQISSVEFWANPMPIEYFLLKNVLTDSELPNLLADGEFDSNETIIEYTQVILAGSIKIENSTSNGYLNSSKILIEVGTNPYNYLYKYKLTFSKSVDFSSKEIQDKNINILGENYTINSNSINNKIILNKKGSDYNLVLENNQSININNDIINGTYVYINNRFGNVTNFELSFAMQNPEKDYILVGGYYDNPVFENLRLFFKSYSAEKGAEIYIGSVK